MAEQSESNNSSIQLQVDLLNSALVGKDLFLHVINACLEDKVQFIVSLTLDRIGDSLYISRKRIEDAQNVFHESLRNSKYWPARVFIRKLGVSTDLPSRGWPEALSKSIGLTKTFLLATACQTCYSQKEIAELFYEMMWLWKKYPSRSIQAEDNMQFVNAISGYGNKFVPLDYLVEVSARIKEKLSSPHELIALYERCSATVLAKLLVDLFDALRDPEIIRITLEGARSGCFLTATLSWLMEDDIQCFLKDRFLFGGNESRLVIRLIDSPWHIGRWTVEEALEPIYVEQKSAASIERFKPTSHTPCEMAIMQISAHFEFDHGELVEATGVLAGAVVELAYKYGSLYSEKCKSTVLLKDVCASGFISSHINIMSKYGWSNARTPETRSDKQSKVFDVLESWIITGPEKESHVRTRDRIHHGNITSMEKIRQDLFECNVAFYDDKAQPMLLDSVDKLDYIIQPAIYLAGDALLCCFEESRNPARRFRPKDESGIHKMANLLYKMVFQPYLNDTKNVSEMNKCLFSEFWIEALKRSVPGYPAASPGDLAISQCGYVAFAKVLESISTKRRDACVIAVVPGSLRKQGSGREGHGRASKLVEIPPGFPSSREIENQKNPVRCFLPDGEYIGIEPKPDPSGAEIRFLVDRSMEAQSFRMISEIKMLRGSSMPSGIVISQDSQTCFAPVSWVDSIEAIAFAEHVYLHTSPLRPDNERTQAEDWRNNGIYDKIAWHQVGKFASQSKHNVAMTDSNEELRFFEAGHLGQEGKLFIRHECPLIQCLILAIKDCGSSGSKWSVIV